MTLKNYLEKKNLSDFAFSQMLGVSKPMVRMWTNRVYSPRLVHAVAINRATRGKVKYEDLLSHEDMGILND